MKNSNVLEGGISDHHSLIITALKSQLVKGNAKTKLYRDYSEFNMDNFKAELDDKLKSGVVTEYSNFQNIFIQVLNNHAPAKKKIVRFSNSPFMTKTLRKAIMHRSRLKNIYIRKRNDKNWENNKQRNFFVDLLRKTKTEYFKNLNVKDLSDSRKVWKTTKLYFSNKGLNSNKLLLKEKGNLVSDEKELATIMNNFFINITKDLEELKKDSKGKLNNLEDIVKAFESHPSIEKIKKAINTTEKFSFRNVKDDEVRKFIMNLGGSKATPVRDIPTDMLKQTMDIHLPIMTQIINMSIDNNCYPDDLKFAEVSPVFKKKDDLDKENYRPVSVLSHVSKVFVRIMYQIEDFMKDKLSNLLTGFRKNHNTQHCLMSTLESWKKNFG